MFTYKRGFSVNSPIDQLVECVNSQNAQLTEWFKFGIKADASVGLLWSSAAVFVVAILEVGAFGGQLGDSGYTHIELSGLLLFIAKCLLLPRFINDFVDSCDNLFVNQYLDTLKPL